MGFVEFASRMGPTRRELNPAAGDEPLETWVTLDLNEAPELRQMRRRPLGATIGTWLGRGQAEHAALAATTRRGRMGDPKIFLSLRLWPSN